MDAYLDHNVDGYGHPDGIQHLDVFPDLDPDMDADLHVLFDTDMDPHVDPHIDSDQEPES